MVERGFVRNWKVDGVEVVYVGRGKGGKVMKSGYGMWGNRFVVGVDGSREEVVRKYVRWLKANRWFVRKMKAELKNAKVLVCWCKAGEVCHGDVMVSVLRGDRWLPVSLYDIKALMYEHKWMNTPTPT